MLHVLGERASAIVFTRSTHPRAADPGAMAALARDITPSASVFIAEDIPQALDLSRSLTGEKDLLLATGSIFVVAGVREAWFAISPQSFAPGDWAAVAEPIRGNFSPMLHGPEQNPDVAIPDTP